MQYKKEIKTAIDLISISIRTAPKSCGLDDILFISLNNSQINRVASMMSEIGRLKAKDISDKKAKDAMSYSWSGDAETVKNSQGVMLIGVRGKKPAGVNCTGCGFRTCKDFISYARKNKNNAVLGHFCMLKTFDLGIAIASAAKTASDLNVDNRIMYRIGVAAQNLGIFNKNSSKIDVTNKVSPVLGLPLSISGKNIYFDRLEKMQAAKTLKEYFSKK